MKTSTTFLIFALLHLSSADISEYFHRDPYDQLDLFRQSEVQKTSKSEQADIEKEEKNGDDLYEEYYDYLSDVGAISTTTTTTQKPTVPVEKLRLRKGPFTVADDILSRVKKPRVTKKRYQYNRHRDNVAAESIKRSGKPPMKAASKRSPPPRPSSPVLPGLENVERLIPSSLKTVIEDSGKRIVKAVMQPINSVPRNTQIRETSFTSKMESWMQPYRTYFGYMAPTFAPAHITTFLVTQWVSTIAITVAWITVGFMYQSMIGRSDEGRSSHEPWEELVPDSNTMAIVFRDLSDAAARWHDEL